MSAAPRRAPGDLLVHLRRARDHVDRHYAEPLDLAALAAVAGISTYHFQRPHSPEITRALDEGGMHGLGMNVDDCPTTTTTCARRASEFVQPPEERPYGVEAVARDNSGNWMALVEERAHSPADFGQATGVL